MRVFVHMLDVNALLGMVLVEIVTNVDFADDFLEYVFHRENAYRRTELIHHHCQMIIPRLQLRQCPVDRLFRRQVKRFADIIADRTIRQVGVHQVPCAQRQNAFYIGDVSLVDRQTVVAVLQNDADGFFHTASLIESDNIGERYHRFADSGIGKTDDASNTFAVNRGRIRCAFRQIQQRSYFFACNEHVLRGITAAGDSGTKTRHPAEDKNQWIKQIREKTQNINHAADQRVRFLLEHALGHDFAQNQQNRCHYDDRNQVARCAKQIDEDQRTQGRNNNRRQVRSHQRRTQDYIRCLEQTQYLLGTAIPHLGLMLQLELVRIHHCNFGTRKKSFQHQENNDQQDFSQPVHDLPPACLTAFSSSFAYASFPFRAPAPVRLF